MAPGCAMDDSGPAGSDAPRTGTVAQAATFDWGGDCSEGADSFTAFIPLDDKKIIGTIPAGKRDVFIALNAAADVDVQLIDEATGREIIAWPYGDLNGPTEECTTYSGVRYCYSGYNGTGGDAGNEWIRIEGDTNRPLIMKAYGYAAGDAVVDYNWKPVDTCAETGSGSFQQFIPLTNVVTVGDIPVGKVNVKIALTSPTDVDVQLFDGATAIVKWPDGIMNDWFPQSTTYKGMTISWSGWAGDGANYGNEYIRIEGATSVALTMKAFGYAAGTALVEYEWGAGAGDSCVATTDCAAGFECKSGECHGELWCGGAATAALDCADVIHPAVSGQWGCDTFQCAWEPVATSCSLGGTQCGPGFECDYQCADNGNCGINPTGVCRRSCTASSDCAPEEYCGDSGVCRVDTTCKADADCLITENDWDRGACIATSTWGASCSLGSCARTCTPIGSLACDDIAGVDFGLCAEFMGFAYDSTGDDCVSRSGCGDQGHTFYPTYSGCSDACL